MNFLTNVVMGCNTVVASAVAFLTGEGTTEGIMPKIIEASSALIDFGFSLFDKMLEHPILIFFFAASFIGVGIGVIGKMIRLARKK